MFSVIKTMAEDDEIFFPDEEIQLSNDAEEIIYFPDEDIPEENACKLKNQQYNLLGKLESSVMLTFIIKYFLYLKI